MRRQKKALRRQRRLWAREMKHRYGQMGWMLRGTHTPQRHMARYDALERTAAYMSYLETLYFPGDEGQRPATWETFYQVRQGRQACFLLAGIHLATARRRAA